MSGDDCTRDLHNKTHDLSQVNKFSFNFLWIKGNFESQSLTQKTINVESLAIHCLGSVGSLQDLLRGIFLS